MARPRAVDVDYVGDGDGPDAGAAIDLGEDQALLDELSQRFADRAAPGAERLGQGDLGEPRLGPDAPLEDRGAQLVQYLIGGRAALDGAQTQSAFADKLSTTVPSTVGLCQ